MKIGRIVFPLWQLLPSLLLLSAILFTEGNPQRSPQSKETAVKLRRKGSADDFIPSRIRKKRQLFDGLNFQFGNVLTRAMEGLDTMLKSSQNFDVFNCLQRISCEITAPLNEAINNESGRQLRREFLVEDDTEVPEESLKSEESAPEEQSSTPSTPFSVPPLAGFPPPYHYGHISIHPMSLPYYYPWLYGVHPYHLGANLNANFSFPQYSLPVPPFSYHPHFISAATPLLKGEKSSQPLPQLANNDIEDLNTQASYTVDKHDKTREAPTQTAQSFPTLINPRNRVNEHNQDKESYASSQGIGNHLQGQSSRAFYQIHNGESSYQNYGDMNHGQNYQKQQYQTNEASYQNRDSGGDYQTPHNRAIYQNEGNWANLQHERNERDSSSDSIQRIGFDSQENEEESPSWFSGYRRAIRVLKNRRRSRRRNQDDGNWFRRVFGRKRRRRSLDGSPPTVEAFKRRVRRGIMETLSKAADSGKEFMGALERMMQGASGSSLYPMAQAALMGYAGTPKTCEQMYPTCPTSSDEMIQVFNNLNRYFPNGIPFRDRIPRPLRFFIP